MTNSQVHTLRIPPEIEEALQEFCKQKGQGLSQVLLTAACKEMNRLDLIEKIRPSNRPKKQADGNS